MQLYRMYCILVDLTFIQMSLVKKYIVNLIYMS